LLNLRGSDIPYNPVFFAFVIVTSSGLEVFIEPNKLTDEVRQNLKTEEPNIVFHPYDSVSTRLSKIVSVSSASL